jgi:MYXO-CTERM domain-containing protein
MATPTPTLTASPTSVPSPTSTDTPTPTPTATATPTMGAADVTFVIGSAIGLRGETTTIAVMLRTGAEVVETQNEIIIFNPEIQFVTAANGQPSCTVNPVLNRDASFTLDCDEADVCTLGALVRASGNPDPIPDGSVLYSCEIGVDLNADSGTYLLVCATSTANEALSAACDDGAIEVGEVPTASPTPSKTPLSPPATATITVTPTKTRSPRPSDKDDGCQVTAAGGTHGAWMLALPIALLWRRRRRLSRKTLPRPTRKTRVRM